MFESIKRQVQSVRHGDMRRKKRWMIAITIVFFLIVLVLWVFVFGTQSAAQQEKAADANAGEFWNELRDSFAQAQEALQASMRMISNIPVEEALTEQAAPSPEAAKEAHTPEPPSNPQHSASPQPVE